MYKPTQAYPRKIKEIVFEDVDAFFAVPTGKFVEDRKARELEAASETVYQDGKLTFALNNPHRCLKEKQLVLFVERTICSNCLSQFHSPGRMAVELEPLPEYSDIPFPQWELQKQIDNQIRTDLPATIRELGHTVAACQNCIRKLCPTSFVSPGSNG